MTTTDLTARVTSTVPVTAQRPSIAKHGIAAAVLASVATTALASIASAVGVSFKDGTGTSIPLAACAQLTLVFSLLGLAIAAVMARKARRPRSTFLRTTVTLTVLSFVPDLTVGFDAGSAATLMTLHTIAALIVVPTLAGRLSQSREG